MSELLKNLFKSHFLLDVTTLPPETYLRDLPDWDSMTHMTFIMKLEDELGIAFSGDEIVGMQTLKQVEDMITQKKG